MLGTNIKIETKFKRQRPNTTNSNGNEILQHKQPREKEKKKGGADKPALQVNNEIRQYM